MVDSQVLAFAAVVAVLTLTPGADTMLVIRNVLARGISAGPLTVLGISAGVLVHAGLSSAGLSFILVRSAAAFEVVKLAGAGYLVYLGGRSLLQALRGRPGNETHAFSPQERQASGPWGSVLEGLLTNLLNPKVAVFYLAFLPQFIQPDDPALAKSLLLAAIHILFGLIWLSFVSIFVGKMRHTLTRPRVRRGLEGLSGAILIGFGLRLALERSR